MSGKRSTRPFEYALLHPDTSQRQHACSQYRSRQLVPTQPPNPHARTHLRLCMQSELSDGSITRHYANHNLYQLLFLPAPAVTVPTPVPSDPASTFCLSCSLALPKSPSLCPTLTF